MSDYSADNGIRPAGTFERLFGRYLSLTNERREIILVFRRDPLAIISIIVIAIFLLASIFAPFLTPYPEEGRGVPNVVNKFLPPSISHPFGTDELGRDILARVMFAGRISLFVGLMVPLIAVLIGLPLGALAGFFGGVLDEVIMRITDIFLAFPPLLLAIAIAAAIGSSLTNAMIAIAISWWPWYARLVRTQTLSLKQRSFVDAARCMGVKDLTIIRRHIIPHVVSSVLVQFTLDIGSAILTAAGLSFIGLGVKPPAADWGRMISTGRLYFFIHWWYATFPGVAIFIVTLAFNLLSDTIQKVGQPRAEVVM